jgi:DUF1365 family protein
VTLAGRLAAGEVLGLRAIVTHERRGPVQHGFRTLVDHVLLAPETARLPALMSRNRLNLTSWHDADHGGPRGRGQGAAWAWAELARAGLARRPGLVLALLTQPRFLGFWFAPVSFWMALDGDDLVAVIAEVNNTFGQRHSYVLARPDFAPITPDAEFRARKVFHVSPFQDVSGEYRFGFALRPHSMAIRIRQVDGDGGVNTAMSGPLEPLGAGGILAGALRRPGGALRVIVHIYWHALRLKMKGIGYRPPPPLPDKDVST